MIKFKEHIKERLTNRLFLAIIAIYILLCIGSSIYFGINLEVRNSLMSFFFTLFVPVLLVLEYWLKIRCGDFFVIGVLFIAFGGILGSCYDLYSIFPLFDTILHGLAGFIFACIGFSLAVKFFGNGEEKKHFFGSLVFAICFSLAMAVVWEIFEYACTEFLNFDMMEDTIVSGIDSYLLSGSHAEIVTLDGITKTIIHYGNGKTYVIDGYLDLGLIDTLDDLIICTIGAVVFAVISTISYFKCKKINEVLIPQNVSIINEKKTKNIREK